jgi:colanic acid/amylovoran biosynthesis glycosyltransferase
MASSPSTAARIALVVNRFPALSETFIHTKAIALRRAGLDVTVIAAMPSADGPLFTERFDGPVELMDVSRDLALTTRHLAARVARLTGHDLRLWDAARRRYGLTRRALRAAVIAMPLAGFDILHLEYTGLAVAYLDALVLTGAKIVTSCRGTAERMTPIAEPARADELRAMFEHVDRVHCVSQDLVRTCAAYGLDPAKAFVNNPAIDATRFHRARPYPARTGRFELLSTGRLHWAKGIEWGILAVKALVDAGVNVRYTVIGAGPEDGRLRFLVHDLGLGDHVVLAGRKPAPEVRAALEGADLYVLPSVSEGISNAALEAMAMELPVVSTSVGGMAEAITDGVDGVLVPSRSPREMAHAIAGLLSDHARRASLGTAGRRRVIEQFSIERQTARFVAEYEALR